MNKRKFKIGDKVAVVKRATEDWFYWNVDYMDDTIGKSGTISKISTRGSYKIDELGWWYLEESLRLCEQDNNQLLFPFM